MAPSDELKALVDQMPAPDSRGMYCHVAAGGGAEATPKGKARRGVSQIDKDKIDAAVAGIAKLGKDGVLGLIDMLVEPGRGDDVKPHYALHCLVVHVGSLGDDKARGELAQALASQIGPGRPTGVRKYLIQEVQGIGGAEVAPALAACLGDEALCDDAARALVAIGPAGAACLRNALGAAKGPCRLTVVQNLGVLRDAPAADALRQAVGDTSREVRLAAAWGLANLGDAASVDLLLKAADVEPSWERTEQTKACLLLAERLAAAGRKDAAARVYQHLADTRKDDSERYVREQAQKALGAT